MNYYADGGYNPALGNYYAPNGGYYDDSYSPDSYYSSYSNGSAGVVPGAASEEATVPPHPAPTTAAGEEGGNDALSYYSAARAAFLQGDYQDALRQAAHAELDAPGNPRVHELISLALFALGNYQAAASEAHAAMAMGPIAEWKNLYRYYEDVKKYTSQLRALEKAAAANPGSAAEHFLLGYHFSMMGARRMRKRSLPSWPSSRPVIRWQRIISSNSARTHRSRLRGLPRLHKGKRSKPSRQSSPYFCILACRVGRGIPNRRAACV